jgi:hypothetical protein
MRKQKQLAQDSSIRHGYDKPTTETNPQSYYAARPSWGFRFATFQGRWSVENVLCDAQSRMRLCELERRTWAEIKQEKKQFHSIPLADIKKEARAQMEELRLDERTDTVFSIRITGKKRLFGIIEDGVFLVLWYDPDHEICPSELKNT